MPATFTCPEDGAIFVSMRAFWASALLLGALSCSSDPPAAVEPLPPACDACLREAGADGCGDSYQACIADEACEDHILCELRQGCYYEPADGGCLVERGCAELEENDAANDADAFEACARDTCRSVCGFREE